MAEAQIGDQAIRYDREATEAAYETVERGETERCGCIFCRNFAAQRNLAYPSSFRALLQRLGIDPAKEGEVFEYGPVGDGCHLYGGWFYLVGELVTAGECNCSPPESPENASPFEFFFTRSHPKAEVFRGGPLLAIEFTTHLKWVIPESPEYKSASGESLGRHELGM